MQNNRSPLDGVSIDIMAPAKYRSSTLFMEKLRLKYTIKVNLSGLPRSQGPQVRWGFLLSSMLAQPQLMQLDLVLSQDRVSASENSLMSCAICCASLAISQRLFFGEILAKAQMPRHSENFAGQDIY